MEKVQTIDTEEQLLKKIAEVEREIFRFTNTLERTIHTREDELGSSPEDTALEIENEEGKQAAGVSTLSHMRAELADLRLRLERVRVKKKKVA